MNRYGKGLDDEFEPTFEDLLQTSLHEMAEDGELEFDELTEYQLEAMGI